jgi:tetratricopeptide (TPR) repeat protein
MRLVLSVILLAGIGFLAPQSWRLAREAHWLGKAEDTQTPGLDRIEALEKALGVEGQNYETAYDLGEACRVQAWDLGENYQIFAQKATNAYARCFSLNPYYPFSYLGYAVCLDLLKEHSKAVPLYEKALQLDPNGYYTAAWMGWHYVQIEEWAKSKEWFEKSMRLVWGNKMAATYLDIVNKRLAELQLK